MLSRILGRVLVLSTGPLEWESSTPSRRSLPLSFGVYIIELREGSQDERVQFEWAL